MILMILALILAVTDFSLSITAKDYPRAALEITLVILILIEVMLRIDGKNNKVTERWLERNSSRN